MLCACAQAGYAKLCNIAGYIQTPCSYTHTPNKCYGYVQDVLSLLDVGYTFLNLCEPINKCVYMLVTNNSCKDEFLAKLVRGVQSHGRSVCLAGSALGHSDKVYSRVVGATQLEWVGGRVHQPCT